MPFEDFSQKHWKIVPPGSEECKTNEVVKISKTDKGEVMIECAGRLPYTNASYNERANTIEAEGYVIQLQIKFTAKDVGDAGGSWTAEDNPSGPAE